MVRVAKYVQDKLASELVGTPGVDNSAGVLAQSIAASATGLANSALVSERAAARDNVVLQNTAANAFNDVGTELAAKRRVQAQQEAAAQALVNRYDLSNEKLAIGTQLTDLETSLRRDNPETPFAVPGMYKEQSARLLSNYLKDPRIKDRPELVTGLTEYVNTQVASDYDRLGKEALQLQMKNTAIQTESGLAEDIRMASAEGATTATFGKALKNIGERYESLEGSKGPAVARKMIEEAKVDAAYGFAKRYARSNPTEANDLIRWGVFDKWLNEEQKHAVIGRIQARNKEIAEEQKTAVEIDAENIKNKVYAIHRTIDKADPTEAQTNAAVEQYEDMLDMLNKRPVTEENNKLINLIIEKRNAASGSLRTYRADQAKIEAQAKSDAKLQEILEKQQDAERRREASDVKAAAADQLKAAMGSKAGQDAMVSINKRLNDIQRILKDNKKPTLAELKQLRTDIENARDNDYMTGEQYKKKAPYVESLTDWLLKGKGGVGAEFRKFLDQSIHGAPKDLHDSLNPKDDPGKRALTDKVYEEREQRMIDAYKQNTGKAPGPAALEIIRKGAKLKALVDLASPFSELA